MGTARAGLEDSAPIGLLGALAELLASSRGRVTPHSPHPHCALQSVSADTYQIDKHQVSDHEYVTSALSQGMPCPVLAHSRDPFFLFSVLLQTVVAGLTPHIPASSERDPASLPCFGSNL